MYPSGFQTGEVCLPGLRPVTLDQRTHLWAAEVRSFRRFYAQCLRAVLNGSSPSSNWGDRLMNWLEVEVALTTETIAPPEPGLGFCGVYRPAQGGIWGVIGVRRGLSLAKGIFTAGHESGHFLQQIKRTALLQSWVEAAGWDLDLSTYHGEDLADVAGLLALYYRRADLVAAGETDLWTRYHHKMVVNKQKLGEQK